ncbi:hypothetical protein MBLNU459_g7550t1 [Dothideomycetes sp. NU459]
MGELAGALYGVETLVEGAVALAKGIYDPTLPLKANLIPIKDVKLPRVYHTISVIKGRAYIFGGKEVDRDGNETLADSTMHILILPSSGVETTDYQNIPPSSTSPPPRSGHSASVVDDQIYIFGGVSGASPESLIEEKGRVWVFDTVSSSWSSLDPSQTKDVPSATAYHAAIATEQPRRTQESTLDGTAPQLDPDPARHVPEPEPSNTYGTLLVYAGILANHNSELWAFDIRTRIWSQMQHPPLASPSLPTSPSIAMVENRLYTYSSAETHYLDLDMHSASSSAQSSLGGLGPSPLGPWSRISTTIPAPSASSSTNGSSPGPGVRSGAALIPVTTGQGRNYLLLVGGEALPTEAGSGAVGEIWGLQLKPEGMSAASWKDAARTAIGKETAEARWAEVRYYDGDGRIVQEGQAGRGIGARKGFAGCRSAEVDGGAVVVWGGIGAHGKILDDGVLVSVEK